ncbi:MAG TPA: S9 family peptidase [Thermoanaerobaculia bacterium]|nr:S9 family peptidase [Thermoanaerobaculia bacterium]
MKRIVLLVVSLLLALPLAAQKRAFTLEDLYRVKGVSNLTTSKDGKSIAYVVTSSDLSRGKRTSAVWVMDADGRNARQLTQGEHDSSPEFSPDGRSLSFIRDNDVYLLPLRGGEPSQLTHMSTGVSDPIWSPDGKWIAFASDVYPECGADDACNKRLSDRLSEGKTHAHMADTLLYRHWTGWRDFAVTHMFVVGVDDGKVRDVTPGKQDFPPFQLGGGAQYSFAPDGSELAVASNPDEQRASSTNNDIYLVSLTKSGAPRNITAANKAYDGTPKYSPDGRYIAYRMQKTPNYESDLVRLAVYDRQSGTSRVLTDSFHDWVDDFDWSTDSKTLYFTGPVEGRNPIFRVSVSGGAWEKVFDGAPTIDDFEMSEDGRSILYIGRSTGSPAELYRTPVGGGAATQLTHENDAFVREVDVRPAEEMWVTVPGGRKVQVFVVKPHNFDASKKYPLILNVHGGPQSQWADAFRGDWQVYPGAGYVVAFANPTGSTGFGQELVDAIGANWGGTPFDDLMRVTDALEKLPYVDRNRMGAMGWSYGGYMMDWFEGHTDRFKAIASMMGLFDLRSFYGATEELWFPEHDLKGQPWNSAEYEKWSPSNSVKNFKTPCLVISGELDYRVPYTQALQMYTALQKMNVPSRLVIFKEAGHWPNWYEMALYYTAHLEWFHTYLGGGPAPWTTEQFLRNQVFDSETGKRREDAPENTQGKQDQKPKE